MENCTVGVIIISTTKLSAVPNLKMAQESHTKNWRNKLAMSIRTVFAVFLLTFTPLAYSTPNEGFIKVNGGSVWYKIYGSGKKIPLLLVHGGPGGSSCNFEPITHLDKNRKIIYYDQLGSGRSEEPTDLSLWNINRFVEELDQVRKTLHLSKVHILAHSWGAAIVGQYLVSKGTKGIVSVTFVGPYLSTEDWLHDTNELRKQLPITTQEILANHERNGTTASAEYQRATGEFYQLHLSRNPTPHVSPDSCKGSKWNQTIYDTMWGNSEFISLGNLKNFDVAKQLNKIKIPTLFLIGEFDEIQEKTIRQYQLRMKHASVVVIKGAAHMSMTDKPEEFLNNLNRFIVKSELPLY